MIKKVKGKWILFAKGGKEEIARFGSEQAAKDWEKEHKASSKGSKKKE